MNNEGQYKFDGQLRVSCVAVRTTERPQRERQGNLFQAATEREALEAWENEYAVSEEHKEV